MLCFISFKKTLKRQRQLNIKQEICFDTYCINYVNLLFIIPIKRLIHAWGKFIISLGKGIIITPFVVEVVNHSTHSMNERCSSCYMKLIIKAIRVSGWFNRICVRVCVC